MFGTETGYFTMPALDFEIFLKYSNFLRTSVLSCLATRESLVHSASGDNNLAVLYV